MHKSGTRCGKPRRLPRELISARDWQKACVEEICSPSRGAAGSRANEEIAKKWAARLVPLAKLGVGRRCYFSLVRTWGWRLQRDLRERYLKAQSDSPWRVWPKRLLRFNFPIRPPGGILYIAYSNAWLGLPVAPFADLEEVSCARSRKLRCWFYFSSAWRFALLMLPTVCIARHGFSATYASPQSGSD